MERLEESILQRNDILKPFFDWDYQIGTCNNLEEVSKFEIQKSIEAFRYLRQDLGEDFPINVLENDHKIGEYLINTCPWTRVWFTWLANSLRELDGTNNFHSVKSKFHSNSPGDFDEAICLLEYGLMFRRAGFKIDFEEAILNVKGIQKKPDIKLSNLHTGENIYVEVTRLTPDAEFEEYSNVTQQIIHGGLFHKQYLSFSGKLFKRVSKEHWKDILEEIFDKTKLAATHNTFQEIFRKGTIELAIAPYHNNGLLVEWSAERRYDINSFQLPHYDDFSRIKNKIKHKLPQTSDDSFNLLIIQHEDPIYLNRNPAKYISEIEETLYKCPEIAAVCIIGYEFGGREKVIQSFGMNYYIQKTIRHAMASNTIIIFNKFHKKVPITLHSLSKLIEAFCI